MHSSRRRAFKAGGHIGKFMGPKASAIVIVAFASLLGMAQDPSANSAKGK